MARGEVGWAWEDVGGDGVGVWSFCILIKFI